MFPIDAANEYHLDDIGRIRPVHQMGWVRDRWQDVASFEEAMEGNAAFAMAEIFPNEDVGLGSEELSDFQAKRYLDIADAFYLGTGIDARFGVWRFKWQGETFFTMRPDFVLRSLATGLNECPINILESAIRDRLLDYREVDALKYAIAKGEVEVTGVYPMEWWIEFWKVRGIHAPCLRESAGGEPTKDKSLKTTERRTLLTIIAVLCNHSGIDCEGRGAAAEIEKLTEERGTRVSEDTVRRILSQIPEAVESRKK